MYKLLVKHWYYFIVYFVTFWGNIKVSPSLTNILLLNIILLLKGEESPFFCRVYIGFWYEFYVPDGKCIWVFTIAPSTMSSSAIAAITTAININSIYVYSVAYTATSDATSGIEL